ncbi:MAG: AbrB/MazE/SpoVT family DNA-binding domain-containing protein [Candidatus Gracilibacteria bacterium]
MQISITKWGNSMAIRLPKPFIEQIGVNLNQKVEITLEKDTIVLKKASSSLAELLSKVNENNIHKETDTGNAVGNEAW